MFFRPHAALYRQQSQFEMKYDGAHSLLPLSNGFLLDIVQCRDDYNTTILRLFDPASSTKIAERVITASQARILSLDKDSFLLQTDEDNKNLPILSSVNLQTLSNYEGSYPNLDINCLVDNGRWSVWKDNSDVNSQVYIIEHHNISQCIVVRSIMTRNNIHELSSLQPCSAYIIKLDNGQIVFCPFNQDPLVYVCESDRNYEHKFPLSYIIRPKVSRYLHMSANIVALPNGRLLTYQGSGNHFQVWKGEECIQEWSWSDKDIKCSDKKFRNWTEKVAALPDGDHLLMKIGYKIFIFNMETRQLQKIEMGKLDAWDFCVYPNGQVVILGMDKRCTMKTWLCIDLACMVDYRRGIAAQLCETIGKDVSSIVNNYLDLDGAWSNDEVPSTRGRRAIN